jgi:DNA-binding NarL/FixJ family response regulator
MCDDSTLSVIKGMRAERDPPYITYTTTTLPEMPSVPMSILLPPLPASRLDGTTAPREQISVMLVDDHPVCRAGVRSMLAGTEFHIQAEAHTRREAVELAQNLQPQLVLLEIRIAGGDGLAILHTLKTRHPEIPVVILTMYNHPVYVARAVAEGASGYLLKGTEREELLAALRAVRQGQILLGPEQLTRWLRSLSRDMTGAQDFIQPLSRREADVLQLLGAGLTNRGIARILFIAESTVKTHVEHIIHKLGVADRTQVAVWAARQRLGVMEDVPPSV